MSRVSTFAGSSFSPDRMFRSTTAPVSKFLNLVRVNAAPLPGLMNWNSITVYGFPSISTLRPLRISDVSYMARHVYPAVLRRVKPVCSSRLRYRAGLAARGCVRDTPRVDVAGHYRHLIALGREEFLAAAAPAAFVRYPSRMLVGLENGERTLAFEETLDMSDLRIVADAANDLEVFPLVKKPSASFPDRITIGRTQNNDIEIPDHSVSRLHAYVRQVGEGWVVADAGSKNGSW